MDPIRSRSPSPERAIPPPARTSLDEQDQLVQEAAAHVFTLEEILTGLPPDRIRTLSDINLQGIPEYIMDHSADMLGQIESFKEEIPEDMQDRWLALAGNPFIRDRYPHVAQMILTLDRDIDFHNKSVRHEKIAQEQQALLQKTRDTIALAKESLRPRPPYSPNDPPAETSSSATAIPPGIQPKPPIDPAPPRPPENGHRKYIFIALVIASIATICLCRSYSNRSKGSPNSDEL